MEVPSLLDAERSRVLRWALREDEVRSDVTTRSLVPADAMGAAVVTAKQRGVVAGVEGLTPLLEQTLRGGARGEVTSSVASGTRVEPGTEIARLRAPLRTLLAFERTALNLLQRMSGIATLTAQFVEEVRGTRAAILATRKTAPGLRAFDLFAVRAGGGEAHRTSLADRILVKRNHLLAARAAGTATSMADVVARLQRRRRRVPVGIEVTDLVELRSVLLPGVDVVLLDNLSPDDVRTAVGLRDAAFPAGDGPALEASGGITLANVRRYAETGVERISVGALTHSAPALDLSMRVVP